MKPPAQVRIGPWDYTVVRDHSSLDDVDDPKLGHFQGDDCEIYLNTKQPRQIVAETLLHEVLHGIFAITGLDGDFADQGEDAEEKFILRFSPVLASVFRDNPDLIRYLAKGLEPVQVPQ